MAMRGYEVRLLVSMSNQASSSIRRLGSDIERLKRQTTLANKQDALGIKLDRNRLRQAKLEDAINARQTGAAARRAELAQMRLQAKQAMGIGHQQVRQISAIASQYDATARISKIETRRLQLLSKIGDAEGEASEHMQRQLADLDLDERTQRKRLEGAKKRIDLADKDLKLNKQQIGALQQMAKQEEVIRAARRESVQMQRRLREELSLSRREAEALAGQMQDIERLRAQEPLERRAQRGRVIAHGGRVAGLAGLLGTVGLGAAAQQAAEFGTATQLAATQAGTSLQDVIDKGGGLQKEILDLMDEFPAKADEMAAAAYEIFSSTSKGFGEGVELLRKVNQVAVAGGTDLKTATNATITVLNNFQGAGQDVNATLDDMFSIVRYGRMNFQQFDQMLTKVAPAAQQANQGLKGVGAAMAVLTRHTPSPRQAGTQLARLIDALNDSDFQKGIKNAGIVITDTEGNLLPLIDVFNRLDKGLGKLKGRDLTDFFQLFTAAGRGGGRGVKGQIESRRGLTTLMKNLGEYRVLTGQVTGNTNEFLQALDAMKDTPAVQWQIFTNQMQRMVITLGQEVIPVFAEVGSHVKKLMNWFDQLSPAAKNVVGNFMGWGAISLLVGGVAASLIGNFLVLSTELTKISNGAITASRQLRALGAIGAIAITLNVIRKGDASAWDMAGAALSGAMMTPGGPVAKLIGAGIMTITVIVAPRMDDKFEDVIIKKMRDDAKALSQDHWVNIDELKQMEAGIRSIRTMNLEPREILTQDQYRRLEALKRTELVGQIPEEGMAAREVTAAAKRKQNNQKDLQAQTDYMNKLRAWHERVLAYQKEVANREAQIALTRANARKAAIDDINQAASRLTSIYNEFKSANESAFGELFQGPFLTSESAMTAKEWGVKFGMGDLIKDLQDQTKKFQEWRNTLVQLKKRGAPSEMIAELQKMGPEALGNLQTLAKSAPGQFNKFVGLWKGKQKVIADATKIDFDDQLKQWFKFGSDIAKQIIFGLRSEDVALDNNFRKYITGKFPGYIDQMIKVAVDEFNKQSEAFHPTRPGAKPKPPGQKATSKAKEVPTGAPGKTETHEHYHVHTDNQESVRTANQKARALALKVKQSKATAAKIERGGWQ